MKLNQPSASAEEDHWQRRATSAAIEAARKVIKNGVIPVGTPIGRLSDTEWGWLASGILFGWISTRAEQATAAQLDTEMLVRLTALDPQPWDAGAVATILPELAEMPNVDWSKPVNEWPCETMVEFLLTAVRLIRKAMIARDLGGEITRKSGPDTLARQINAAAGGPLMTPNELNDEIKL